MTSTERGPRVEEADQIIESLRDAEQFAFEAVRKFVEAIDSIFPDVSQDGPRRKVVDAAFKMTEQLVSAWTQAAEKMLRAASDALAQSRATMALKPARKAPGKKAAAKTAPGKKAAAKRAAAKKSPAKKAAQRRGVER